MNEHADLFRERYNTPLLADAAFRAAVSLELPAPGLRPLDPTRKLAGPVVTVEANNDLVAILEAVHRSGPGDVVVISNDGPDAGLMGDLIGAEAVRKGLGGFLVDGRVRDSGELIEMGVPVFCRGTFPAGPLKLSGGGGPGSVGGPVVVGGATIRPGMWAFGDVDGVLFVDHNALASVFERAAIAERQEQALADLIASGTSLADAFELDSFLVKRQEDPGADFNAHLAGLNRAI